MSDMMTASSAPSTEQKPWLGNRAADTSETIHEVFYETTAIDWTTVTIDPSTNTMICAGTPSFSGSSSSSTPNLYTNTTGTQFVYDLPIGTYSLLTYADNSNSQLEPPATGIWLGTSSGGTLYPPAKHDA